MWILLGLLIFLLLVVILFLLTPIRIHIDSIHGVYLLKWGRIAVGYVRPEGVAIVFGFRLLLWKKESDLFQFLTQKKQGRAIEKQEVKKKAKRKFPIRLRRIPLRIIRVLRSFQVRQLKIDMDTDDVVQNAYLYPLFYSLRSGLRDLSVNNEGRLIFLFQADNNLFRMLRAFLLW